MSTPCPLCGGACEAADLRPLLVPELMWLWEQLAATADRRGDPHLVSNSATVRAPDSAEARAEAGGLIGGPLRTRQRRTIDLAMLALTIRTRGPALTPGAVAAHAVGRRLGTRSLAQAERERRTSALRDVFDRHWPEAAHADGGVAWLALQRAGWVARMLAVSDPHALLVSALEVVRVTAASVRGRVDRRRLASDITGNAHALDDGTRLAGLVLATFVALGWVPARTKARAAWALVGVDCDDLTGGLIAVGISPSGWTIPPGCVVTIPPRELRTCEWPGPSGEGPWVFVTENPSIAAAAADLAESGVPVRLLCTSGTPSKIELAAVARLARAAWRIAVRADFDPSGLRHVAALLDVVRDASPWRMSVGDYRASLALMPEGGESFEASDVPPTPWSPALAEAMADKRVAAHEEVLIRGLLGDLRAQRPLADTTP